MKRTPLSIGTQIQANSGSSYTYVIDRVIGDGASSIVYEAHYVDNSNYKHCVRLKECYPYQSSIERAGNELIWSIESERINDISAFKKGYDSLMTDQKSNYIVHAFTQFENNNTMYIVMNANDGLTFDQTKFESLKEILLTIKLLTYVVGDYHQKGYLHLDIKPSNFLVYPRPSEHIVLFDVDSITSIKDIEEKKAKCVSYSKGWAAPEQMQGRIDKLCPATDIYSIGAILFQKVMGRAVENEDIGIFADWDFDGEMFDNVNPAVKRLLREIFKKTLAANIKRRYQTTSELIDALDNAILIANQKQYIISNVPASYIDFVGRKNELSVIHDAFASGTKALFIQGFAGIGKSELVRKYINIYKNEYDAIVFQKYSGHLANYIESIGVANNDGPMSLDSIRKICEKSKVLFVVDNFDAKDYDDVLDDLDDNLDPLLSLNANFIFTTRNQFSDVFQSEQVHVFELEQMPSNDLLKLFNNEYGKSLSGTEQQIALKIIEKFDKWTLIVPMLAKHLLSSGLSVEQFFISLKNSKTKYFDSNAERIRIVKDGRAIKENQLGILRYVLCVSDLRREEKECLRNLYLLDGYELALSKTAYKRITRLKNLDSLNGLIDRNWVKWSPDDNSLSLHPIVKELILMDLGVNVISCESFLKTITGDFVVTHRYDDANRAAEQHKKAIEWEINVDKGYLVAFVFSRLDLSRSSNARFVIEYIYSRFNGDIYDAMYCASEELVEVFYTLCSQYSKNNNDIKLNSVIVFLYFMRKIAIDDAYRDEDAPAPWYIETVQSAFVQTMQYLLESDYTDKVNKIYVLIKPLMQALNTTPLKWHLDYEITYDQALMSSAHRGLRYIEKKLQIPQGDKDALRKQYKTVMSYKENETADAPTDSSVRTDNSKRERSALVELLSIFDGQTDNGYSFVSNFLCDEARSSEEKNDMIEFASSSLFYPLRHESADYNQYLNQVNWLKLIPIFEIHSKFFDEHPNSTRRDGKFDLGFNISQLRLSYIYAYLNMEDKLVASLEDVFKNLEARHLSNDENTWWNDKRLPPRYHVDFESAITAFCNLNKPHFILPYILRYKDIVKVNLQGENADDDSILFDWYIHIINCAEKAFKITGDLEYLKLYKQYKNIVETIKYN